MNKKTFAIRRNTAKYRVSGIMSNVQSLLIRVNKTKDNMCPLLSNEEKYQLKIISDKLRNIIDIWKFSTKEIKQHIEVNNND